MKFFTLPPLSIPHPYIIINANHPKFGYLKKYSRLIQEVIVDSGVEIFRNPSVKDYPQNHIYKILRIRDQIRSLLRKKIYVTVPDYCDDYNPKSLWLSESETNIERTVENIIKYTDQFNCVNWLIPVQGWNKNPSSIKRCISSLDENGIVDRWNYFAVGNLCVETNINLIYKTAKLAGALLQGKKIHLFGVKLKATPLVAPYIDSFDSLAWTRPVDRKGWSCKNTKEREEYFLKWMKRLQELQPLTLDPYIRS